MRGVKEGRCALQTNFTCHSWITALYRRAGIGLQQKKCGGLRPHSATMSEYILTLLVILGFGDIFSNVQTLRDADSEQGKTDAAAIKLALAEHPIICQRSSPRAWCRYTFWCDASIFFPQNVALNWVVVRLRLECFTLACYSSRWCNSIPCR